jgi:hypothetical protein
MAGENLADAAMVFGEPEHLTDRQVPNCGFTQVQA